MCLVIDEQILNTLIAVENCALVPEGSSDSRVHGRGPGCLQMPRKISSSPLDVCIFFLVTGISFYISLKLSYFEITQVEPFKRTGPVYPPPHALRTAEWLSSPGCTPLPWIRTSGSEHFPGWGRAQASSELALGGTCVLSTSLSWNARLPNLHSPPSSPSHSWHSHTRVHRRTHTHPARQLALRIWQM